MERIGKKKEPPGDRTSRRRISKPCICPNPGKQQTEDA